MAIDKISFERALEYKSDAAQVLRSGQCSVEQKTQIAAKWGADFVNQALSVDNTEYKIDDEDFNVAKQNGKDEAADKTGYDGSKSAKSIGNAAMAVGGAAATGASSILSGTWSVGKISTEVAKNTGSSAAKSVGGWAKASIYVAAALCIATAGKYWLDKPNKEQKDAAENLQDEVFGEAAGELNAAQDEMAEATAEVTELSEQAEEETDEANEQIEENKTLFDFYKAAYEEKKAKQESGQELTQDEKDLMKSVAPQLKQYGEEITDITEESFDSQEDINDDIAGYQDVYDTSAETVANVEGITDYAEGFDENARTMMNVEAAAQGVNAVSGGLTSVKLFGSGPWNWALGAATAVAAGLSGTAMAQQLSWAHTMTGEIHERRDLQDLGSQTNDVYNEELDNYAGNIEIVEDLELEVPEDMTVPADAGNVNQPVAQQSGQTAMFAQGDENKDKSSNLNDKKDDVKDDKKNIV